LPTCAEQRLYGTGCTQISHDVYALFTYKMFTFLILAAV
jgi:hypothetical protein